MGETRKRQTNQQVYYEFKPVEDDDIRVRMDTPSKFMRDFMKLRQGEKIMTVRVPTTFTSYETHHLTNHKGKWSYGHRERMKTIEALATQKNKTARDILQDLAAGKTLTLKYMTPLPYLHPGRGVITEPKKITPEATKEKKKKEKKKKK